MSQKDNKINSKNQEKAFELIMEITDRVNSLELIFQKLSTQDKMMAGGVVVGVYSPWSNIETIRFIGNRIMVPTVINRILDVFKKGPQLPPHPTPPSDLDLN